MTLMLHAAISGRTWHDIWITRAPVGWNARREIVRDVPSGGVSDFDYALGLIAVEVSIRASKINFRRSCIVLLGDQVRHAMFHISSGGSHVPFAHPACGGLVV